MTHEDLLRDAFKDFEDSTESVADAVAEFSKGLSAFADAFKGMKVPDLPKLNVDNFFVGAKPKKGELRRRRDTGHRVIVLEVGRVTDNDGDAIVEYSHIDNGLEPDYRMRSGLFMKTWADVCEVRRARMQPIDFNEVIAHVENDVFSTEEIMSGIKKGQVWGTTLGVFKVVAVFKGKRIDDQVYLKCLSSIHPDYIVKDVYWEYPEHILKYYRRIKCMEKK